MATDTTTYAQSNIGRNIENTPMSLDEWHRFISDTADAPATAARTHPDRDRADLTSNVEVHTGVGTWVGVDGAVTEESAKVALYAPEGIDLDNLMIRTESLAAMWRQDSIAVVTGSTLVTPVR